ncbi:MAG TPA: hypothetical protein VME01_07300 [Solirubrobacteraceae bacterium]|nr:hypothetical protein [Solirubrobacteraceae bacterium]
MIDLAHDIKAPSRFEALCAEVQEYDHLPTPTHDQQPYPTYLITGENEESQLDMEILAGLVTP